MAVDWRASFPDPPAAPDPLADDATDGERAAHEAATATYQRSTRVWWVGCEIGAKTYFPELAMPAVNGKPSYRELLQADSAIELVDRYAPNAPEPVRNEAAARTAGWLRDVDPAAGSRRHGGEDGSDEVTFRPASSNALRASGGMGLLTGFKVRRAGSVAPA